MKYNIIIKESGSIICECSTFEEAARCKHELITIDKLDKIYIKGFYKIVRA